MFANYKLALMLCLCILVSTEAVGNVRKIPLSKSDSAYLHKNTLPKATDTTVYIPDKQATNRSVSDDSGIQSTLCIALLLFAFLICAAEVYLFILGKMDSTQIVKLIVITLIIFAILFLVTAGYDDRQIQPAIGLLGTIAGYLLGKSAADDVTRAHNKASSSNSSSPT